MKQIEALPDDHATWHELAVDVFMERAREAPFGSRDIN
jgi:hypothetical protein